MIFDEQISRKPDLYPWTQDFIKSIQDSHWTVREFNFQSDVQDFKTKLTEQEKEIITRALATIGQLEISVKKFWSKLGDNLPHPSLFDMGYVFSSNEVVHGDAYERLLENLGLEDSFEKILDLDIVKGRVNYLRKHLHKFHDDNKRQFVYSIILFSIFVENIALFSQFYTVGFFGRYKNLLKDTNKQIEYTSREECYVDGTEVLTPNGWVDLKHINVGDSIFQYTENQEIETTKVLRKIEKDYSGEIYTFSRSGNLCSVTPNHDMVFFNQDNKLIKKNAKDIKFHKNTKVPKFGIWNQNGDNTLSFEDRLKIAIQADGHNSTWINKEGKIILRGKNGSSSHSFSLTKLRKQERLEWILNNLNLKYSKSNPDANGKITYRIHFNHDLNYKNFDWIDLSNKSREWCLSFLDEVVNWDGYKTESNIGYCSINKSCIDKVQTIAILAGKNTSFYTNTKKGYENPCYKLSITDLKEQPISHSIKKSITNYEGKVRCVTVPSGVLITRLNGKTFICGNCLHFSAGAKIINTIKKEYPELFDEKLENKILYESEQAIKYEFEIIEWIVNGYGHKKLNSELLKEFIKDRLNNSLQEIGYKKIFDVNKELLKETEWFNEQLLGNNMTDFFNSRVTEYSKGGQSFSSKDLF